MSDSMQQLTKTLSHDLEDLSELLIEQNRGLPAELFHDFANRLSQARASAKRISEALEIEDAQKDRAAAAGRPGRGLPEYAWRDSRGRIQLLH